LACLSAGLARNARCGTDLDRQEMCYTSEALYRLLASVNL
jgi:hypothetical protein